ncbi:MAG: amidohydrolase family protein [Pseudomonadota bacterium]
MNPFRHAWLAALSIAAVGCAELPTDNRRSVDLIVEAEYLLTMTSETVARDQAVAIDAGIIVAVDDAQAIASRFRADKTIGGEARVLMPGLVNGHTHAAMALMRGIADDLELMTWLTQYIFPAELELVDEDFIATGTTLACYEMIRGGITSFVDMYFFPDTVAQAVVDCGLRAIVVPSVIEQASPDAENFSQSLSQAIDFAERWRDKHPRIIPALGAHSVYTIGRDALETLVAAANDYDLAISIHVAESPFEMQITAENYGKSPVALLEELGYLDVPLIAAHVVHGDTDDWQRMARQNVGAIHNPTSNLKLSSGVSPVVDMRRAGVTVGLGTDGAASNNDLDLWEEIRLASLLAKGIGMVPTHLPAYEALKMATADGAAAVGLADQVGSIEVGKRADLIQIATDDLTFAPLYEPISHLVYVADEHDVVTTIVEGVVLMQDREILTIDATQLRDDVARHRDRIRALVGKGASKD